MSSSNLELVAAIKEVTYGITPAAGNFQTVRYTSESLSGNPNNIESAEARQDRASGGSFISGLEVAGDINVEIAPGEYADFYLSALMAPSWVAAVSTAPGTYVIDNTTHTITDTTPGVDLTTIFQVGGLVKLTSGFLAANNGQAVYITAVAPTVITYAGTLTTQVVTSAGILTNPQHAGTGGGSSTTIHSFTMEKNFLDLTDKAIDYTGMLVNGLKLNMAWGALLTGAFSFNGQGWNIPATPITNPPRVVDPPGTNGPLNASQDITQIIINSTVQSLCFQKLDITLNNGLTPQNCLGRLVAQSFTPGTATIDIAADLYLGNTSFQYVANKITNTPISIYGVAQNAKGGIGFVMPTVLLNSPDPASGGANQDIVLNLTGKTVAPPSGANQFTLYIL